MIRSSIITAVIAVGLFTGVSAAGGAADLSAVPVPADRAADSYMIYSLLLPKAPLDHIAPANIQQWGLADTTVSISDMNPAVPPRGQLKAPPENVKAFNEAARDFETRKYQRFRLNVDGSHPVLSLPLLNRQQVGSVRDARSPNSGIAFFSGVYFNNDRTAALVYVNVWCANFCNAGEWVYLEKQSGSWVRRSGILQRMS